MKIYTITCNNAYNYGAVLQAYGLQKYLTDKGCDVEIINFWPPHLRKISKQYRKNVLAILARKILYFPDYHRSKSTFANFRKKYLNETPICHNAEDIKSLPHGDLYICGSDQIWNPDMENGYCPEYFMHIGKNIKKVSYAASIGLSEIEKKYEKYIESMLIDFTTITVREKASVEMLSKMNISSSYVVDPVYLLSDEEWRKVKGNIYNENYILVYALHHVQEIYDYAIRLGKSLNCKVFVISVEIKEKRRGGDKFFWNPQVGDFISLIDGAQAVVTNSFHGVSFSCIFQKPVHIFDTEKNDIRIKNVLEIFDMHDRIVPADLKLINNSVSKTSLNLMACEIKRSKKILDDMIYGVKM